MRPKPDELQRIIIGLAVDQNQIGLHMAVAVVFPVAGQCVVAVAGFEWLVCRKQGQK